MNILTEYKARKSINNPDLWVVTAISRGGEEDKYLVSSALSESEAISILKDFFYSDSKLISTSLESIRDDIKWCEDVLKGIKDDEISNTIEEERELLLDSINLVSDTDFTTVEEVLEFLKKQELLFT